MTKRRLREFVIDPSSGQYSGSRLALLVLVLVYLPALLALEALGIRFPMWAQFALIVGSVAGAYGANSAARAWKGISDHGLEPGQGISQPPAKPKGE